MIQSAKASLRTIALGFAVACAVAAVLTCGACAGNKKASAQAPPKTLRIDAPSGDDYSALSAALAKVASGGTVELGAGVYDLGDHALTVKQKSVRLVGAGREKTELQSTAGKCLLEFYGPGKLSTENLGFRHIGSLPGSAVLVQDAQVSIQSCRFRGAQPKGTWYYASLYLKGHTTGVVLDCTVSDGSAGIDVDGTSQVTVQDNVCSNCLLDGIGFVSKAGGEASGNKCNGNKVGIAAQTSGRLSISGNVCTGNTDSGMWLYGRTTALVEENRCSNNHSSGIWIGGNAKPRVTGCVCTLDEDGIDVLGSAQPRIVGNTCDSNRAVGLGCWGHTGGRVVDNQCNRNGGPNEGGICIGGHANVYVSANSCEYNRNYGILFRDSARGVVAANYCSQSSYGILVDSPSRPTLKHNTCEYNRIQDIYNWR